MGFGNNWDWGNKGSNYNFQRRILEKYADCCALPPPSSPPPPPVSNTIWYMTYTGSSGPVPDNIWNDDTSISSIQDAANYLVSNFGSGGCLNTQSGNITIWCTNSIAPTFTIFDIGTASYIPLTWVSTSILFTDCFEFEDTVSNLTDYYTTILSCPPIGSIFQSINGLPSTLIQDAPFNTDFQSFIRIALGPQITTVTQIAGLTINIKISNNIIPLGSLTIENGFTFAGGPLTTPCTP